MPQQLTQEEEEEIEEEEEVTKTPFKGCPDRVSFSGLHATAAKF